MALQESFLTFAADTLVENLGRIDACVSKLPPDALWRRGSEHENAVGNLLLHLEGNVRQWILSGIGGMANTRDRASEFSARSGKAASVLLATLQATVHEAERTIRTLPFDRLTGPVSIQGEDTTVLEAIFHVVEHFTGHTYQIILLTKQATQEDLGFYAHLSSTQPAGRS